MRMTPIGRPLFSFGQYKTHVLSLSNSGTRSYFDQSGPDARDALPALVSSVDGLGSAPV